MANSAKRKGDQAEREVAKLLADLLLWCGHPDTQPDVWHTHPHTQQPVCDRCCTHPHCTTQPTNQHQTTS